MSSLPPAAPAPGCARRPAARRSAAGQRWRGARSGPDGSQSSRRERSGGVSTAENVTLAPWPLEAARRLVDGQPPHEGETARWHPEHPSADVVDALALALRAYEVDGPLRAVPTWWVHEVRHRGQVVGVAGFHGPPAETGPVEVEIGYAVVPALRGRGVATRACGLLLDLAWRAGADLVRAETEPENSASRTVLVRCGFRPGPDGLLVVARPALVVKR